MFSMMFILFIFIVVFLLFLEPLISNSKTKSENEVTFKQNENWEFVVETLRNFGINCIEEQYSCSPILKGNIICGYKQYDVFRLDLKKSYTIKKEQNCVIVCEN